MFEGMRVRNVYRDEGIVVKHEPLSTGMCDILIRRDDGSEIWCASSDCRLVPGGEKLTPTRRELRRMADEEALVQLKAIREQHIAEWNKPWPGMEFCKTLFGRNVDDAIADVRERLQRYGVR